jgi:hypothetical protein
LAAASFSLDYLGKYAQTEIKNAITIDENNAIFFMIFPF